MTVPLRQKKVFVGLILFLLSLSGVSVLGMKTAKAQLKLRTCTPVNGPQWTQGTATSFSWQVEVNDATTCEAVSGTALSFTYTILSSTSDLAAVTFGSWECLLWKSELIAACVKTDSTPSERFLVYANPASGIG